MLNGDVGNRFVLLQKFFKILCFVYIVFYEPPKLFMNETFFFKKLTISSILLEDGYKCLATQNCRNIRKFIILSVDLILHSNIAEM